MPDQFEKYFFTDDISDIWFQCGLALGSSKTQLIVFSQEPS
jgi:hypothetical protein